MPDQPQEPQGRTGPRQDSGFDWLYPGDNKAVGASRGHQPEAPPQPGQGPADGEASGTRIISQEEVAAYQNRASGGPAPTPPYPQQAPTQLPQAPKKRRRVRIRTLFKLAFLAWLVFLIAVPIWGWAQLAKVNINTAFDPGKQAGHNYLLVGSDSRDGLTKQEKKQMGTGGVGDVGKRTDTIMILHTGSGKPLLMSIPRDSIVPIPEHGTTKINAAFAYGGPKLLVETIERNTGLHIDDYIEIGFGGFVNAVDAVGGVKICPESDMDDPRANLKIKAGCQEADGLTALGYARSRHTMANGDLGRAQHQREVFAGIGKKVRSPMTVLNPLRYYGLSKAMATSIKVSKGTQPWDLARFAWGMTQVSGSGGLTCSVPIRDLAVNWDEERSTKMFELIQQDKTDEITDDLCTAGGLPE